MKPSSLGTCKATRSVGSETPPGNRTWLHCLSPLSVQQKPRSEILDHVLQLADLQRLQSRSGMRNLLETSGAYMVVKAEEFRVASCMARVLRDTSEQRRQIGYNETISTFTQEHECLPNPHKIDTFLQWIRVCARRVLFPSSTRSTCVNPQPT